MKKSTLLLLFLLALADRAAGQTKFEKYFSIACDSMRAGRYDAAQKAFRAADECLDRPARYEDMNVQDSVKKAGNLYVNALIAATQKAEAAAQISEARRLVYVANNLAKEQPLKALRLAETAWRITPSPLPEVAQVMTDIVWNSMDSAGNYANWFQRSVMSPDSQAVAAVYDNFVWVYERRVAVPEDLEEEEDADGLDDADGFVQVNGRQIGAFEHPLDTAFFKNKSLPIGLFFSLDGKRIITWSEDGVVCLWGLDGQKLRELQHRQYAQAEGPRFWRMSVGFSSDGEYLFVSANQRLFMYDLSGTLLHQIYVGSKEELHLSTDHRFILGVGGGQVEMQYLDQAKDTAFVLCRGGDMLLSPDSKHFVAVSEGFDTLRVWNHKAQQMDSLWVADGTFNSVQFSADGSQILISDSKGQVRLLDLNSRQTWAMQHEDVALGAIFMPNGRDIISWSMDNTARIWSNEGKQKARMQMDEVSTQSRHRLTRAGAPSFKRIIMLSDSGRVIITRSENYRPSTRPGSGKLSSATTRAWSLEGERLAKQFPERCDTCAQTMEANIQSARERIQGAMQETMAELRGIEHLKGFPKNNLLLYADDDVEVEEANWVAFFRAAELAEQRGAENFFSGMGMQANLIKRADLALGTSWRLQRSSSNRVVLQNLGIEGGFSVLHLDSMRLYPLQIGTNQYVRDIGDISQDGQMLATYNNRQEVDIWDDQGRSVGHFKIQDSLGIIGRVEPSPDKTRVFVRSGYSDGGKDIMQNKVYSLKGEVLADLGRQAIDRFVFSSDGARMLTFSEKQGVKVFGPQGDSLFAHHPKGCYAGGFVPNSHRVYVFADTIFFWDDKGEAKRIIPNLGAGRAAKVSPDGKHLLYRAGQAYRLETLDGRLIHDFPPDSTLSNAFFSPDGNMIQFRTERGGGLRTLYQVSSGTIAPSPTGVEYRRSSSYELGFSSNDDGKLWNWKGEYLGSIGRFLDPRYPVDLDITFGPRDRYAFVLGENGENAFLPMPQTIYDWLKSSRLPPLSPKERVEYKIGE